MQLKIYRIIRLSSFLGLLEFEVRRISRQSAQEGGKAVTRLYTPGNICGTHLCYRLSLPCGHNAAGMIKSMKCRMISSGIEPAIFRLVAQCLNQLGHRVPHFI